MGGAQEQSWWQQRAGTAAWRGLRTFWGAYSDSCVSVPSFWSSITGAIVLLRCPPCICDEISWDSGRRCGAFQMERAPLCNMS